MVHHHYLIGLTILAVLTTCAFTKPFIQFEYHNYDELTYALESLHQMYPELCDLYSIGQSVDGRELWVLVISGATPEHHTVGVPEVKYVGNMHGNEVVGREMLLHFAEDLLCKYNFDEDITRFVDRTRVHILPTMNPDGFEDATMGCTGAQGRYNRNGYDLNRNFPGYFEENEAPIQAETQAIMDWLQTEPFVLSANLHGGALLANYPYDNLSPEDKEKTNDTSPYSISPDDDIYRFLALGYSQSHPTMHILESTKCGGSFDGFKDGITNGADWYPLIGGMQDYNYIRADCMEITLEIACCKYPEENTLEAYWMENRKPLLEFLKQAHRGVTGIVRDMFGRSLNDVKVSIEGRDNPYPFTTNTNGEYWRILLPGIYTVMVEKEGYLSQTQEVLVNSYLYNVEQLDFYLQEGPLYSDGVSVQASLSRTISSLFLATILWRSLL